MYLYYITVLVGTDPSKSTNLFGIVSKFISVTKGFTCNL